MSLKQENFGTALIGLRKLVLFSEAHGLKGGEAVEEAILEYVMELQRDVVRWRARVDMAESKELFPSALGEEKATKNRQGKKS
jgi:hypothetical protein